MSQTVEVRCNQCGNITHVAGAPGQALNFRCPGCGQSLSVFIPQGATGNPGIETTARRQSASARSSAPNRSKAGGLGNTIFWVVVGLLLAGTMAAGGLLVYVMTSPTPEGKPSEVLHELLAGTSLSNEADTRESPPGEASDVGTARSTTITDSKPPQSQSHSPAPSLGPIESRTGDAILDEYLALAKAFPTKLTDRRRIQDEAQLSRSLFRRAVLSKQGTRTAQANYQREIERMESDGGSLRLYAAVFRVNQLDPAKYDRSGRWWRWMLDRLIHGPYFQLTIPSDKISEQEFHRQHIRLREIARIVFALETPATAEQIASLQKYFEPIKALAQKINQDKLTMDPYWEYADAISLYRDAIARHIRENKAAIVAQRELAVTLADLGYLIGQAQRPMVEDGHSIHRAMNHWKAKGRPDQGQFRFDLDLD
ncbi:MAG: hypothetical protein AAF958_12105 [Planctomycetota bacterium]